jgi:hypothetical protein
MLGFGSIAVVGGREKLLEEGTFRKNELASPKQFLKMPTSADPLRRRDKQASIGTTIFSPVRGLRYGLGDLYTPNILDINGYHSFIRSQRIKTVV